MCSARNAPRFRSVLGLAFIVAGLSSIGFGCGDDAPMKSFDQLQEEDPKFKASMDKSMERYNSLQSAGSKRKGAGRGRTERR